MFVPTAIIAPPEDMRPRFHFTAPAGWINDPNGLVYENGNYHLFYQHNPFGTQWGNMHWGHAISRDLIHWHDLGDAIAPDKLGTVFSGSAVIDQHNTSGLGQPGKRAMVCFYTAAGGTNDESKGVPFSQCMAYSLDGRIFTKYAQNPIVPHIAGENRDPKVIWDEDSKKWVMALYLDGNKYALLDSSNLKEWSRLAEVDMPDTSECPDFFPLNLDGDPHRKTWVFWGADGNYMLGNFDGASFHANTPVLHSSFGNTGYAAQTYSNASHGRRIQISWFRGAEFPGCPWNQQMGFPNELTLKTTPQGPRLCFQPVAELAKIRGSEVKPVKGQYPVPSGIFEVEGRWKVPATGELKLNVHRVEIAVDAAKGTLSVMGQSVPIDLSSGTLTLHILRDTTTAEIYAQDGAVMIPFFILPVDGGNANGLSLDEGHFKGTAKVFELKP